MVVLYNISIVAYTVLIGIFSFFHPKARLWRQGRKNLLAHIEKAMSGNTAPVAWFHCASLGEFEQARPLLEAFKKNYPLYKIFLTFFSPSGYEIRKNYPMADKVFYLPADTKYNADRFITLVKPSVVFFTKYEFWYHYLHILKKRQIPTLSFSAIFNERQVFFKSYGRFYLSFLACFDKIFVQDTASLHLLKTHGILQAEVAGDTRFDRVLEQVASPRAIPIAAAFKNGNQLMVAGSTWPDDFNVLQPAFCELPDVKIIIAPHEIHEAELEYFERVFPGQCIRYSKANPSLVEKFKFLLIDNIGMLSALYQYADIAYIGGGFGKGIHNILEAAAFGMPVVFGPNFKKFKEARDLEKSGSAFPVKNAEEATKILTRLLHDQQSRSTMAATSSSYVISNAGATKKILNYCHTLLT